jgi:tetratricopeptide (TPR) repeat protein
LSRLHPIAGCDDGARRADVVFVHGLGGDLFATWRHGEDESTSWPHWLGREFSDVGVWSLGYAASATKWARLKGLFIEGASDAGRSMALPDRALQVLDLMVKKGLGSRPLLFVCHSLGGLLVKYILRKANDPAVDAKMRQVAANTRAVLFLATPHAGAPLASLVDAFRLVFGATVSVEDLRAHDAHLRDLYNWYRGNAPLLGIETRTYYETRGVGEMLIVNPTSAQSGAGADAIPLDEDHLSIAKPRDREAQVCDALRELLREYVLVERPAKAVAPLPAPMPPPSMAAEPRIVVQVEAAPPRGEESTRRPPCELPPRAEEHVGRQTELNRLAERLRAGKNSAVVGPGGLGKTALAAEAVRAVVGQSGENLAASPFPDGVVLLDLYTYRGRDEPAWNNLANALGGPAFRERSPARERAIEACRGRRALIILEGGEEADGQGDRSDVKTLCSVFSPQNCRLLLTRNGDQAVPSETIELKEALHPDDAARLFDTLTEGRVGGDVRERVLALLQGHPLALTWAGNLLARGDEDPARLADDWQAGGLPKLSDPTEAEHTLDWLFNRSVRGLDDAAQRVLAAAGLLARAPFPLEAMRAFMGDDAAARDALRALVLRGLLQRTREAEHWQFTHVLGYSFARKEKGSDPALRESLARWVIEAIRRALGSFDDQKAPMVSRLLEHAAALLRTDDDQQLWTAIANPLLYDVMDRLKDFGRLDLMWANVNAVSEWLSCLPPATAEQPGWARERSSVLNRRGNVLLDQGDLPGALTAYRESLAIGCRLAEFDPSNAGWQRDLSVGQEKVGNVLRDQGDLPEALAAFQEALAIRRRLAESDPSNTGWQRDLSVSHERVGYALRQQGDLTGALAAFRESLAIRRRLAESDPSVAGWQRDLSVSHNQVGDVLREQGDLPSALAAYHEDLAISRRLAEADPSNAGWQRDVSVSHDRIGNMLLEQGDLPVALATYRESLAIRRRLAEADPSNTGWQRDLSVSHSKVGDVLREQGELPGALAAYREALAIIRRLAAADSSNTVWQRDLSVSHNKVGGVLRDQGERPGALAAYREALAIRRRLAAADLSNAGWQRDLSWSLTAIATLLEQQGNVPDALPLAEESLAIDERLSALDPTNARWKKDVAVSRRLVARLRGKTGAALS